MITGPLFAEVLHQRTTKIRNQEAPHFDINKFTVSFFVSRPLGLEIHDCPANFNCIDGNSTCTLLSGPYDRTMRQYHD